ncbi:MAG: nicotinate (nicotinamide) nucleotide adenylyltransferase [Treponema sp.]|nr:nicotinate (nicotinamide) nucleotide adenylyltransferase [Treponema sp.]
MKIALLGGSFNPLHIGHCMLAETVIQELHYDKVLFVPVNIPPHKQLSDKVSAQDRFEMIKAFCQSSAEKGKDYFIAEDCELKRGGISYTYDTLVYVTEKYKLDGKPAFIMGQETAAQFDKWHKASEIAKIADLILARRHPDNNGIDTKVFENVPLGNYTNNFAGDDFEKSFKYEHIMLENPVLPISSTEIRSRIANGKGWRYLVPEAVFQYIIDHNLYGTKR